MMWEMGSWEGPVTGAVVPVASLIIIGLKLSQVMQFQIASFSYSEQHHNNSFLHSNKKSAIFMLIYTKPVKRE